MLNKDVLLEAKKIKITPDTNVPVTDYTVGSDEKPTPAEDTTDTKDYTTEETDAEPNDYTEGADDGTDAADAEDPEGDSADTTGDEPNDYTDGADADGGDAGNAGDTAMDPPPDPVEDPEEAKKNLSLLSDFIQLFRTLKSTSNKISDMKKTNILSANILNQINKNINLLEETVFQFVHRVFPSKKYIENLYQYNCFIQALKINIEMMKKIKYLDIG